MAEETSIVERKGVWYSYQGTNFAQGRALHGEETIRSSVELT